MTTSTGAAASDLPQELQGNGLAAVTLSIEWQDARAAHRDESHVPRFSVWREADLLPATIAAALPGSRTGACHQAQVAAAELVPPWSDERLVDAPLSAFDRHHLKGLAVTPRRGRFYPQGFFAGMEGVFSDAVLPARLSGLHDERIEVDFNHPLAPFPLQVGLEIEAILPEYDRRGGRCVDPLYQLMRHPGMLAPLRDGSPTDYGDRGEGLDRMDDRDDALFYSQPRRVQHLDVHSLAQVEGLYARLLPAGAKVLDLMGSFDSHLQQAEIESLQVLGLNAEELAANAAADRTLLQDLNRDPSLPLDDASLDAVVCTASIEYLTRPFEVLAETRRVLRPGGLLVVTFSNRWFPTKAIHIWSELHEFERLGMVSQWLEQAGFEGLQTLTQRGWLRPEDDPHVGQSHLADPLFAVWGRRPAA